MKTIDVEKMLDTAIALYGEVAGVIHVRQHLIEMGYCPTEVDEKIHKIMKEVLG